MSKALKRSRGAVSAPALLFDEDTARAVLELTSPSVDSEEAAAKLFARIARGRPGIGKAVSARSVEWFETSNWAGAQALIRRWLPKVAAFDRLSPSTRAAFLAEFNEVLSISSVELKVGMRGLTLTSSKEHDSIENVCVRALIPFLIPNGWAPRRLAQCQYEKCRQWFLRPEPKRGSVPLYCNPKHANLAHVRAFWQRQRGA